MNNFKLENPRLPDKPSDGLLACVNDLEMCEQHPAYAIDMGSWHTSNLSAHGNLKCFVCLGGARLARGL